MKNLFLFFFTAAFLEIALLTTAQAQADVEFILDVSGSMEQKLNGEVQLDSARKALLGALENINEKQLVAVRVYGHRIDKGKKDESCKDTELLIPFSKLNRAQISSAISSLSPRGYTPIAYSLEQSRNDLLDVGVGREVERVIILLTDGEETCGGDPIAVLKKLQDEGFKLTVFTVGFNVNDVARNQLKEIATFTGGKYFDAKNAAELNSSLKEATKASAVLLEKKKSTYGAAVRGGDSYETAAQIETGKELKLDHHQKKNDFDYFYVDLKVGDEVNFSLNTLEKGIQIRPDGTELENVNPYAGLQLHDSNRSRVKELVIIGGPSHQEKASYRPAAAGRYYILVGNIYEFQHKDQVTFRIEVVKKGDADTDQDAGSSMQGAMKIQAGRYEKNFIGEPDSMDVFAIEAKMGEKYTFGVIPNNTNTGAFSLRLTDEFKQQLYQGMSASNSGLKSEEVVISEDGTFFLELQYLSVEPMEYTLVIKKKEAAQNSAPVSAPSGQPLPTPQ